jgi:hypothetical protein
LTLCALAHTFFLAHRARPRDRGGEDDAMTTQSTQSTQSTPSNPFFDAFRPLVRESAAMVEVMREATLTGLDSALAMQDEARKTTERNLAKWKKETERWNELMSQGLDEMTVASFDLVKAGLTRGKEQVARIGKAAPSA